MNDFKKILHIKLQNYKKKRKREAKTKTKCGGMSHYLWVSSSGRGMGLFDVGVGELGDDAGVGFSVVGEGAGVGAAGRHVDLFGRWFGIVDGLRHPCGHKIIGSAMNHEHREVGFLHLLDG